MELNLQNRPFSIKLWPPSQNTRQTLVEKMTNNLTTKSIFTQKYETLHPKQAEENVKELRTRLLPPQTYITRKSQMVMEVLQSSFMPKNAVSSS